MKHTKESKLKISIAHIGKKHSPETREKIRNAKLGKKRPDVSERQRGEKHPRWKGDSVGIDALHTWIRKHLPKPELCEICKKVPPYDLANISGKYLRDITDWQWLCRRCHMLSDGRMIQLAENNKRYWASNK